MSAPRRRLLADGTDPDPRFTLANERTFLAWIRTALAFIAAGVAVEAFAADVLPGMLREVVGLGLVALGTALAAGSFVRWYRVESALRAGRQLPLPVLAPVIAVVLLAAGVAVALVLLLA